MYSIILVQRDLIRALFCVQEKSSHGSGARIRITPKELQRKAPRSLGFRVRFRAIDSGPLEPKQLDW